MTSDLEYHRSYHAKNREARNASRKALHGKNKEHHRDYCRRYREDNAGRIKEVKHVGYAAMRDSFDGRALILWRSATQRARTRGEECSLTLDHIVKGLSGPRPRTGVLFDLSPLGGRSNPYAPSVDKIDRLKPYSDENVQVVCWAYNRMKSDMSDDQLRFFCGLVMEASK